MSVYGRIAYGLVLLAWALLVATIALGVLAIVGVVAALPLILTGGALGAAILGIVVYMQARVHVPGFYDAEIACGLGRAFREAGIVDSVELDELELIVLSDQHKGARDPADDFHRSERAYCAALAYYYELDHRLVVLGDAEELWENTIGEVMEHNREVFALERRFHRAGRYERVWGNHDDVWRHPRTVRRRLWPALGKGLVVREALKIELTQNGNRKGILFCVHGHQGTADSEVLAPVSRLVVRLFRLVQSLLKRPWNTPATDTKLRERHDLAMFRWAREHWSERVILIAGHTHRPVFERTEPPRPAPAEVTRAGREAARRSRPDARARARAEAAYVDAERRWIKGEATRIDPPCYFNTGCCAFADGDATGIEISGGQIRLIRFPDNEGRARPEELDRAGLAGLLRR
jgi:UDP-2,3-diacylglucosamine pyrophosphatase LpxH